MNFYHIVIAEDHRPFRRLLRQEVERGGDLLVIGEVDDGVELLELLQEVSPDLVILDLSMPRLSGLEAVKLIRESHPRVKILVLSMHRNPAYVELAKNLGAMGYVLKEEMDEALLLAIGRIREGDNYFSPTLNGYLNSCKPPLG
jgi:DNA-binding NarL/FixJ family response regulator|uniref:Response regulator transcription factor n=1 Tax=Desulfobacca acetoxidans TaxID=60893 RepID=A0A7C3Z1M3_9BACT